MKDDIKSTIIKISVFMLIIQFVNTIFLTICISMIGKNNMFVHTFSLIFSYNISLLFLKPFIKFFEMILVKVNERKYRLDKIDYKYYRDIIDNYSIACLIECYGGKITCEDELVAILLSLLIKKKVIINGSIIEVISKSGLSISEELFVKACEGIKVYKKEYIENQLKEDNMKDALQTDLVESIPIDMYEIINAPIILGVIINMLGCVIFTILLKSFDGFMVGIMLLSIYVWIIVILTHKIKTITIKTKKGIEIKYKLIGLKNFLKNFSIINDRKIEEIILWDDYIIYSILFNLKGNLNLEAYELYKKYVDTLIN